jgi:dihydrolipoamide dehydrogenase
MDNSYMDSLVERISMTLENDASNSTTCDVVVIGGGPGGYVAAIKAAQLGAKVILVEKEGLGGTCLNKGCIPSKSLLRTVELFSKINSAESFGIAVENVSLDFRSMIERAFEIVTRLVTGVRYLVKSNNIQLIEGVAHLVEPGKVEVLKRDGDTTTIKSRNIILATGTKPNITKMTPFFDNEEIITYQNVWSLTDAPKSILIVGSDVIGIEFAQIFQAVGTQVTVIESLANILPKEDVEISRRLRQLLVRHGIKIVTDAQIKNVGHDEDGERIIVITRTNVEEHVQAQKVFVTDRMLNIHDLGLDNIGIAYNNDRVLVNDHMETNIPGVYAVGDVTGTSWAHVAFAEGIVAAENAMGKKKRQNSTITLRSVNSL